MSFYRNILAAVAAMGLATCVFADDTATTTTTTESTTTQEVAAPAETPVATTTTTTESTTTTTNKLNINTATAKELMKIKGINAARAKAIISYRKKHGDFKAVEDLKEVKGFKRLNEKTMQEIEEQVTAG